jgi:hypothetical protein
MKTKIVKCKYPKGFIKTRIAFFNPQLADKYINSLDNEFYKNKENDLNNNMSKRKNKLIRFSKPKKYLLTMEGNKFRLWEKLE